jgi:hypothetical protein
MVPTMIKSGDGSRPNRPKSMFSKHHTVAEPQELVCVGVFYLKVFFCIILVFYR